MRTGLLQGAAAVEAVGLLDAVPLLPVALRVMLREALVSPKATRDGLYILADGLDEAKSAYEQQAMPVFGDSMAQAAHILRRAAEAFAL